MTLVRATFAVVCIALAVTEFAEAGKIVKKKLATGGAVVGAAGATGFAGGFLTAAAVANHLKHKHGGYGGGHGGGFGHFGGGYGGGFHGPVAPVQVHNHHHVHNHLPVPHKQVFAVSPALGGHSYSHQYSPVVANHYGGQSLGLIGGHGYASGFDGGYGKNVYGGEIDIVAKAGHSGGNAGGGYRGSPPGGSW